jgi:citrate lyase subunit beta / citryl-CoA lyase
MVIVDLEDSIAPSAKEKAREGAVQALHLHPYTGKVRAVRVNQIDSPWCLEDVRHVIEGAGDKLDSLVVPKVENAAVVHFFHHLLEQLERRLGLNRISLEIQIESVLGLDRVSEIARASNRIAALHFGPGDFAASVGMPGLTIGEAAEHYPGDIWHHARVRILIAARANGLQAIDGPFARLRDEEGLRQTARQSAALGYDGRWAIHPSQVPILNQIFAPSQEEFDQATRILAAYQSAIEEARGVVELDGEMIDEATRKMAEATVERGQAMGMGASTGSATR